MKRTLTHLGVLAAPPPPAAEHRHGRVGGTVPPGAASRARPAKVSRRKAKHAQREDQVQPQPAGGPQGRGERPGHLRGRCGGDVHRHAAAHARQGDLRLQALHHQGGQDRDREAHAPQAGAQGAEGPRTVTATLTASGKDSAGATTSARQSRTLK